MSTSTHRVLLLNKSIGRTCQTVAVCGHSRKQYGFSTYSDAYGCHVLEITLEDYHKAIPDLARNWHKSRCHWEPHFIPAGEAIKVITPQNSEALRSLFMESARKLSDADLLALATERGMFQPSGMPEPLPTQPTELLRAANDDLPTTYWPLVKIAKELGIPVFAGEDRVKMSVLKEAILAKRAEQKAA